MIRNKSFSSIFQLFLSSAVLRLVGLSTTFLCSVILARTLGPDEYGFYSYIIALVMMASILPQVGLPVFIVRETAKGLVSSEYSRIRSIWSWSLFFILALSGVVLITGFVANYFLFNNGETNGGKFVLFWGLWLVPLLAIGKARGAALRGLNFIWQSQLPETTIRPICFAILLSFFYYSNYEKTADIAMFLHLLSASFALIVGLWLLFFYAPESVKKAPIDFTENKSWLKAILPLGALGAIQTISNQVDILFLGAFRSDIEVGVYKVVASLSSLALFGIQIANLVTTTKIARFFSEGNIFRLQQTASYGALLSAAFTIPIGLLFMFFGDKTIGFFYGSEYIAGHFPLMILVLGQMLNALFGSVGVLLSMSGNEKYSLKWLGISTLINIILNFLWIPDYGLLGAATATCISTGIWNLAFWRIAKSKVGIDGSVLSVYKLLTEREKT